LTMRSGFASLAITVMLLAPLIAGPAFAEAASQPRVVLLSAEGLRRDLIDAFIARGDLPSIARMIEQGSTGALTGVYPANAYSSQASLATGVYPRTHGVLGSAYHARNTALDSRIPGVNSTSLLAPAEPFWATAEKHGLNATIVNFPFSWPPLGNATVVDAADASLSPSVLYTTRQLNASETRIELVNADVALWGYTLRNPRELAPKETLLAIEGGNETLYALIVDQELRGAYTAMYVSKTRSVAAALALLTAEAPWTPGIQVIVGGNPGVLKLRLLEASADGQNLSVYRSAIVAATGFSKPGEIWSTLVNQTVFPLASPDLQALSRGWIGEDVYMETLEMAADWYANSTAFCLNNTRWQVFAVSFPLVEEAQKAFLGYVTQGHPRYQANMKEAYLDRIEQAYIRLDAVVGSLQSQVDGNTVLILASPSGSTPVAQVFYVNRWLRDRGWLVQATDGAVDWNSTRLYYFGDGQLFVNLKGRETNGIVDGSDYPSLIADVTAALATAPVALTASSASMGLLGLGTERAGDLVLVPASGWALSEALGGNETNAVEPGSAYLTGRLGLYPIDEGAEGFLAIQGAYVATGRLGRASVAAVAPTLLAVLDAGATEGYDGMPICSAFTASIGGETVLDRGRVIPASIRGLDQQLADLQGMLSKVKADSAIYPFVVGLVSVAIGLAAGSAIGRRRPG